MRITAPIGIASLRLRHVFYGLVLAAGVYIAVKLVIVLLSPQSVWLPLAPASGARSAGLIDGAAPYDFKVDPFNPARSAKREASRIDAPQTTLNLRLLGLRAREGDAGGGSAVIETPDRVQRRFDVGQEVIRGVTLEAVYKEYVIVSQNSQNERLDFDQQPGSALSAAPERDKKQQTVSQAQPIATIEDILAQVTLRRVMDGRAVIGYELIAAQPSADISATGLEFGDVITAVNGTQVRTQSDPASLLAQLDPAQRPEVTVTRGGQAVSVQVSMP